MSKQPTISVVIPCYNEAEFIADAINSVQSQSFQDFEIIVVDNNSSDNTAKIVENFGDDRIVLISEKQQGLVYARNAGVLKARGEWILRMDADARLHQDWITHALSKLDYDEALAVSSYADQYEERLSDISFDYFNFNAFTVNRLLGGTRMLFGSAMMFHHSLKDVVLNKARIRNDIWEDLDISLNIQNKHKTVVKDTPVYISLRRLHTPPVEAIIYTFGWVKTYWHYSKLASLAIFAYIILFLPIHLLIYGFSSGRIPRVSLKN